MGRDALLLTLGLAVGIGAGILIGRTRAEPEPPPAEFVHAGGAETSAGIATRRDTGQPAAAGTSAGAEEELGACQRALMNSWMDASHPIEVSEEDSSREAARRFKEAYYTDDDPARVEAHFEGGDPSAAARRALEGTPVEGGDVRVSCDPLPCVLEMDLTIPESEDVPRDAMYGTFREVDDDVAAALTEALPGYGVRQTSLSGGRDANRRTLSGIVTTHSDAEMEELLESMVVFAEDVLGLKRFEDTDGGG